MSTRHFAFAALLSFVLLTGCAAAATDLPASTVHKTLTTSQALPAGTALKVENLLGFVKVQQGGSRLTVTATVVAGGKDHAAAQALADTVRLDVSNADGQVVVHVHYPVDRHDRYRYIPTKGSNQHDNELHILGITLHGSSRSSGIRYQGHRITVYRGRDEGVPLHVDLVVSLPAGANADIRNRVGPIAAAGLHATLALHSDSGDVQVRQLDGKLATYSDSGDVMVTDVTGPLSVDADSGDVKVHGANGDTRVNADSGDVTVSAVHGGRLTVDADSGDIRVDGASGPMRLAADSGDIRLKNLGKVPHLRAAADSGDIHVSGPLDGLGSFELSADSGDVVLVTRQPPAVHLDIHGSDIHVDWPSVHNVRTGENRYSGDVGTATGEGRITSDDGDVTLRQ